MNKKTKKAASLLLLAGLTASFVVGCGNGSDKQAQQTPANDQKQEEKKDLEKITVGASPSPHAEILEVAKAALAEKGYDLEIVTFHRLCPAQHELRRRFPGCQLLPA